MNCMFSSNCHAILRPKSIDEIKCIINSVHDNDYLINKYLTYACMFNLIDIVQKLLDMGANRSNVSSMELANGKIPRRTI